MIAEESESITVSDHISHSDSTNCPATYKYFSGPDYLTEETDLFSESGGQVEYTCEPYSPWERSIKVEVSNENSQSSSS